MYKKYLKDFLELTRALHQNASAIDTKMENNKEGQLEQLEELFEKRKNSIEALSNFIGAEKFNWTDEDKHMIYEIKKLEESLQILVKELYEAFGNQMKRISQTKQLSKKYIGAYQNMGTGGSFIDQRK